MKTMAPSAEQVSMKASILKSFETFEKSVGSSDKPFLRRLRNAAIARFDELAFPGQKDEEWRFTPLQTLYQQRFTLASQAGTPPINERHIPFSPPGSIRLTFVDGRFEAALSHIPRLPAGSTLLSLAQALEKENGLVESALGRYVSIESNVFAALNTAFIQDGFVLDLPADCRLESPIHLQFLQTGGGLMSFPRLLVLAGRHSQATLLETYSTLAKPNANSPGQDSASDLQAAVSEFLLDEEAKIDHYRINDVSPTSFHFATQHVEQKRGSSFRSHAITLGGGLVRNDLYSILAAEGCECTLNGLYTVDGTRMVDNHTTIDHAKPHCNSHELYKGIISDKGKGVFNGKIFVRQDAQKTDAKQTNQTLLLSPDATIDTKPQLEIFADDVKCTHGATVGQLDEEMLYYLRTRGIGKDQAQSMLQFAFANDILERIEVVPLREMLERRFLSPLSHVDAASSRFGGADDQG
jgi:Fe-S cluster assembly protein SufD